MSLSELDRAIEALEKARDYRGASQTPPKANVAEALATLRSMRERAVEGYMEETEAGTTARRFSVYVPAFGEPADGAERPALLIPAERSETK